jgi:hypothetical protein
VHEPAREATPFTFFGTGVTWVTREGPDQGIASVTIDGVYEGNLDLFAVGVQSFSQGYSGLASTKHNIVITTTPTKNPSSTGTNVTVDAFVAGLTTTQESSTKVTYSSWAGARSTSASGGSYRVSQVSGSPLKLTFTGTRVDWVTATGPSAGMASVIIDGISVGTVDLYAPTVNWQVVETYAGLSPRRTHTIVVKVLGTKNPASTGTAIVVDAFVVHS